MSELEFAAREMSLSSNVRSRNTHHIQPLRFLSNYKTDFVGIGINLYGQGRSFSHMKNLALIVLVSELTLHMLMSDNIPMIFRSNGSARSSRSFVVSDFISSIVDFPQNGSFFVSFHTPG